MIPTGYLSDAKGRLVPRDQVKPQHLLEDEMVRNLCEGAQSIENLLTTFKDTARSRSNDLLDLLAQEYDTTKGGAKGNITWRSFDGTLEVQVAVQDYMTFGPELQIAKALIDACVTRWAEGADDKLRTLVNDAFQVNKKGRIDTHRVLGLRRLDIDDADWKKAMEAIGDALRIQDTRTYFRFARIDPETGTRTPIVLDLAGV